MGLGHGAQTSCKGQRGSCKIDSSLSITWKWEDEPPAPPTGGYTLAVQLLPFFLGELSTQKGGRGEREWQGPLLSRVDYLMKGNQLEQYGGL